MTEDKDNSLSSKIKKSNYIRAFSKYKHSGEFCYAEDVKQFIKKLKEEFPVDKHKLEKWHGADIGLIIDKLAGKELI